ncbi:MAG: hypothetical protein MUE97_05925 [Phycisphaerales bacterium]|jgi:3-hydroxyacyl-[acyl-carrier-protein] dehydratase|nr:hypothetical protein [Phycisphaerales bacterium]
MHFALLDRVIEQTDTRVVAIKQVSAAEEYLQDHFPEFPVLPGVFMIEAMVHAARVLGGPIALQAAGTDRLMLAGARAIKYGRFVRPGETLVVDVSLVKHEGQGEALTLDFKGTGTVRAADGTTIPDATAVSGRFTLRPVRVRGE